jgi:hypothetical protein
MMHNRILLKGFLCGTCLLFFFCTENEDIFEPIDHPSLKIDGQNPLIFNESTSSLSLTISNTGSGNIDWNASTDKDWLKIVPATGTATGTAQSISVQVNKSGLSSGSYSGSITVSSDWGNPLINVTMKVAQGMWLKWDDNIFSDGTSLTGAGWLWTRFTRPSGWSTAKVTKVQIYLYEGSSYTFDIDGFDSYNLENGVYFPAGTFTSLRQDVSQSLGWATHEVSHTFTSSQFFIGVYLPTGYSNYVGFTLSSDTSYVSGYKPSGSSSHSYTFKIFGMRAFVEPTSTGTLKNPEKAGLSKETSVDGMWIGADNLLGRDTESLVVEKGK